MSKKHSHKQTGAEVPEIVEGGTVVDGPVTPTGMNLSMFFKLFGLTTDPNVLKLISQISQEYSGTLDWKDPVVIRDQIKTVSAAMRVIGATLEVPELVSIADKIDAVFNFPPMMHGAISDALKALRDKIEATMTQDEVRKLVVEYFDSRSMNGSASPFIALLIEMVIKILMGLFV